MNYWTASILVPGWGQFCEGRLKDGVLFFIGTACGLYVAWWWGVLVWAFNVQDAYIYRQETNH